MSHFSALPFTLTRSDSIVGEEIAGEGGLRMAHPAELVLQVRRSDSMAAREFAGELELAIAERALRAAEALPRLAGEEPTGLESDRAPRLPGA